jgi:hypothetical protein
MANNHANTLLPPLLSRFANSRVKGGTKQTAKRPGFLRSTGLEDETAAA